MSGSNGFRVAPFGLNGQMETPGSFRITPSVFDFRWLCWRKICLSAPLAFHFPHAQRQIPPVIQWHLEDLNEAIRLPPHEGHLYCLRAQVYGSIGQEMLVQQDHEIARRLNNG